MADWADGADLAAMSRSGNLLEKMGYDPDEVKASPALRAEVMSKVASPYSATAPQASAPIQVAQNAVSARPTIPNPQSQNGNDLSAAPGQPRLLNRQEPTVLAPRPIPSTLNVTPPTQASMAGAPPQTSASVSPSGTTSPATPSPIDVTNSRQAVTNLLAPEPDLPDMSKQDNMIAAKSLPINPNQQQYREGTGGKIGRGFKALAVGFERGGVPAAIGGAADPHTVGEAGYGDPNSSFGRDDQTRQAQLNLAEKQKSDAMARFKTMADLRKQQDVSSKDAGEIANTTADLPNKTTAAQADATRAAASTAEAYNNSPQGKAESAKELNAQTLSDRTSQISDPKNPLSTRSTADKAYFIGTGKVPDPDRYHAPPEQVQFDAAHAAWVAQHPGQRPGLDDIRSMVEAAKGAERGTMMMVPDGKGGSTATMIHSGDAVPAGSTTIAGMGAAAKDAGKETKAAQSVVDEADLAHQAAEMADGGNAEGDVDLMLSFFKTMKGSSGSGIRFTQQEQNLIKGARSSAGDLMAVGQKVIGSGQSLTPKQRKDVLKIIDLHADQARKHLAGSTPATTTSDDQLEELHWGPDGKLTKK